MLKKTILIFSTIFLIQLMCSCIFCDCPDTKTYEVQYNTISITPYNTAGFQDKEVIDSVYKNAFGIAVSVNFELMKINKITTHSYPLGFKTLTACSCDGDEYIYSDPISYIEIFIIDSETNVRTNATSYFRAYSYNSELITLEQLFENKEEWHDGFQFELVDFISIPNSAVFVAEAYLESGIMLTVSSKQINFYN